MIKIQIPDSADPGFNRAVKARLETKVPAELPVYTVQQLDALTAANYLGHLVVCSNGNAGLECLAYCNGRRWKVVELGDSISLT